MASYNQKKTAIVTHNAFIPASTLLDDAVCNTPAQEQRAMQLGTVFMAQLPDGMMVPCVYDAERSIPGVLRIVRRV
jgi:hypothetical protein